MASELGGNSGIVERIISPSFFIFFWYLSLSQSVSIGEIRADRLVSIRFKIIVLFRVDFSLIFRLRFMG